MHTFLRNLRKEPIRWLEDLSSLFFPQPCAGCAAPVPSGSTPICQRCLAGLPVTGFEKQPDNPVEKLFRGRIPLAGACSIFYFTHGSALQSMIHHLKYLDRPDIGHFLGRHMGEALQAAGRFRNMQALVPLPLYPRRESARGYNQTEKIAEGIAEAMQIPVLTGAVEKVSQTDTQTRKNRLDRWKNVSGSFSVRKDRLHPYQQILLVDDVVTTGATLEACGSALLEAGELQLGIVTLAYADR